MKVRASVAVAVGIFFVPVMALAAPLLPQCVTNPSGSGAISGVACNLCDFILLIQNIINYLIFLAIPIAVVLFAIAGVKYFTAQGNHTKIEEAHHIFRDAGIGFIIALSGWIVVDLFIHTVVSNSYFDQGTTWYSVTCPAGRQTSGSIGNWIQSAFGGSTNYLPAPSGSVSSAGHLPDGVSVVPLPGGGGGFTGTLVSVPSVGANGNSADVALFSTKSDAELQSTYQNVNDKYGFLIQDACNTYGSSIPNCTTVAASMIVVESGGNPNAINGKSQGLMQVNTDTSTSNCSLYDPTCNINEGVKYLSQNYSKFGADTPNAIAAYNSGDTTIPGRSPSGKNSAMVKSVDCPGLYAWQCDKNIGGLDITRNYVGTICQSVKLQGGRC